MSLLFPLYLLGALALGVPLYLHLQRRPPKETVRFSSLRFLKPVRHVRVDRRNKLEHLWLLALRLLALLFLIGMFARPFFKGSDTDGSHAAKTVILLVDTSASMQREGMWAGVSKAIDEQVKQIGKYDTLGLLSFDQQIQSRLLPADWQAATPAQRDALLTAARDALEPGWGGSDLGAALIAAADLVPEAGASERAEIVVIGDLQAGSQLEALRDREWPADLPVIPITIEPSHFNNAAIHAVHGDTPRIRIQASPDAPAELSYGWTGQSARETIALEAGHSRIVEMPPQPAEGSSEVTLLGDADSFDNTVQFAPRAAIPVRILFLGERDDNDSDSLWFYAKRAFPATDELAPELLTWDDGLDRADLVIITEPPGPEQLPALNSALENGARMLLVLSSTRLSGTLRELADWPDVSLQEARQVDYTLLEDINFDHPLLSVFRAASLRDFTKVRTWKYRAIKESLPDHASLLGRFDQGDPAWLEFARGDGRLLVFTSGWNPADGQLARSTKFIPLLYSLLEYAGRRIDLETRLVVGNTIPWPEHLPAEEATWTDPAGQRQTVTADAPLIARIPGLHTIQAKDQTIAYAVNLDPRESDVAPLDTTRLESIGIPYGAAAASRIANQAAPPDSQTRDKDVEQQQKLWRWVVLTLMVLLMLETLIAAHTRAQTNEDADPAIDPKANLEGAIS